MPCAIDEGFRSAFDPRRPSSQLLDVNSYTKSSHSASIRNEHFQSQLPKYSPSQNTYGQQDNHFKQFTPFNDSFNSHNSHNSHKESTNNLKANPTSPSQPSIAPTEHKLDQVDLCDDDELINRLMSNKSCRQKLKQLLLEDDELPVKKVTETKVKTPSNNQGISQEGLRLILIYGLGGVLLLSILDVIVRLIQIFIKSK